MGYTIAIVIIGILLVFIPSWSTLINEKSFGKIKITGTGIATIVLGILLIIFSVLQYNKLQNNEKQKDRQTKIDQDKRDSVQRRNYDSSLLVMKSKFDSSNFITTSIISENLGKYGYRFDSANTRIVKMIKDSSKTKVIVGDDPVLAINTMPKYAGVVITKQNKDTTNFNIHYTSFDAGSTSFNLKYYVALMNENGNLEYVGEEQSIPYNQLIAKNQIVVTNETIVYSLKIKFLYIWVKGSYKNLDRTENFEVDQLCELEISNGSISTIRSESKSRDIINVILSKKRISPSP